MTYKVVKDPEEKLDYTFDYTRVMDGDTIQSSVWTQTLGNNDIVIESQSTVGNEAIIWLSGGRVGAFYKFTNHVVMTPSTREFDRTLTVRIAEK